jgi:ferredoxin-NADP reductase
VFFSEHHFRAFNLSPSPNLLGTLVLEVPGWAGHDAGQHVELRLPQPDGSTTVRPYSISSAPRPGGFDLTIDHPPAGPQLCACALRAGAVTEIRGPAGDRLIWRRTSQNPCSSSPAAAASSR